MKDFIIQRCWMVWWFQELMTLPTGLAVPTYWRRGGNAFRDARTKPHLSWMYVADHSCMKCQSIFWRESWDKIHEEKNQRKFNLWHLTLTDRTPIGLHRPIVLRWHPPQEHLTPVSELSSAAAWHSGRLQATEVGWWFQFDSVWTYMKRYENVLSIYIYISIYLSISFYIYNAYNVDS